MLAVIHLLLLSLPLSLCWEYICRGNASSLDVSVRVVLLVDQHYGKECDQPVPLAQDIITTANDTVQSLNSDNAEDGFTMGLTILDTCSNTDLVSKMVADSIRLKAITQYTGPANDICYTGSVDAHPVPTVFMSQTLPSLNLAPLLESTSSPFISIRQPVTVFQELPVDNLDYQSYISRQLRNNFESMAKVMVELDWELVSVVYSDDWLGRMSLQQFTEVARKYHICIHQNLTADDLSNLAGPKGVVYLGTAGTGYSLLRSTLSDRVWMTNIDLENLAVDDQPPGPVFSVYPPSTSSSTIVKVFNSVAEHCQSQDCNQLDQLELTITEGPLEYSIFKTAGWSGSGAAIKIGRVMDSGLEKGLPQEFSRYSSRCEDVDIDCLVTCRTQTTRDYLYYPGEYNLLVTLPMQTNPSPTDMWGCDESSATVTTLFRAEALMYAIKLKSNHGQYGAVVINSCFNPLRTQRIINDILSGAKQISWNGHTLNPSSIVAVIADFSSGTTLQVQHLVKLLPIPHIAYGASSILLNDDSFKYFARTNADDGEQARNMIRLLQKLNEGSHNIRTVNVIYSDSVYGTTAAQEALNNLKSANFCVSLNLQLSDDANYVDVIDTIVDNMDVTVTILFADPNHITKLFNEIKDYRIWSSIGHHFVLSDTWNDDAGLLHDYGDIVAGSFSFKFSSNFETDIDQNMPNQSEFTNAASINPWRCQLGYLINVGGGARPRGCFYHQRHQGEDPNSAWKAASTESYAVHLMKAIAAVTQGLSEYLHIETGCDGNSKACAKVTFYSQTLEKYNRITDVKISSMLSSDIKQGETSKVFRENGNGNAGFHVFRIDKEVGSRSNNAYEYDLLTTIPAEGDQIEFLIAPTFYGRDGIALNFLSSDDGKCDSKESSTPTSPAGDDSGLSGLEIGLIVAFSVIVVLVAAAVLLYLIKRRRNPRDACCPDEIYSVPTSNRSFTAIPSHPSASTGTTNFYDNRPSSSKEENALQDWLRETSNNKPSAAQYYPTLHLSKDITALPDRPEVASHRNETTSALYEIPQLNGANLNRGYTSSCSEYSTSELETITDRTSSATSAAAEKRELPLAPTPKPRSVKCMKHADIRVEPSEDLSKIACGEDDEEIKEEIV